MVHQNIVDLCNSDTTIIGHYAEHPDEEPGDIAKKLFKHEKADAESEHSIPKLIEKAEEPTQDDLDKAAKCGKFPYRPSDLFLKIYFRVLQSLERDPLNGLVSPSLIGSSGTVPLSIVSVIPDIMRHYGDVIVRAQREVLIATNFWQTSHSSMIVANSLRELNKRVKERGGEKVVVKLIYDRGNIKQAVKNHQLVPPEGWIKDEIKLPSKEELDMIDMEVVNYHRPMLGTFHAKYAIIDRKLALLDSNNIQDRPNVEMMVHLEGPIVDSFYDMFLLSWHIGLNPPLPLRSQTAPRDVAWKFGKDNEHLQHIDVKKSQEESRRLLGEQHTDDGASVMSDVPTHAPTTDAPQGSGASEDPVASGGEAAPSDQDIPAEVQNQYAEMDLKDHGVEGLSEHLNAGAQETKGTASGDLDPSSFHPHIMHGEHDLVPIAMVNRKPKGSPGHGDTSVPQDVAWLAAFKYAKNNIFIQTPTFNASPVVPATLGAVRRGITVTLFLDLGFNDQGEEIPGQGGTNETVVEKMFTELKKEGKGHEKNLQVYWYTAKDQERPVNAAAKKRNCHVKFMSVDDEVTIVGNGNQDTQSWMHSQEINVMLDSKQLAKEWRAGIIANQNTLEKGRLQDDGKWRDANGKELDGATGGTHGPLGPLKGLMNAVARARGTGGF